MKEFLKKLFDPSLLRFLIVGCINTAVGAAIINALVIDAVERLIARGIVPPVFLSANLPGGDEHNAKIFSEYKDNIFYM